MISRTRPNARVVADVPIERVQTYAANGRLPKIGELVFTEHMWTENGKTTIAVYSLDESGQELWSADMFESELEAAADDLDGT